MANAGGLVGDDGSFKYTTQGTNKRRQLGKKAIAGISGGVGAAVIAILCYGYEATRPPRARSASEVGAAIAFSAILDTLPSMMAVAADTVSLPPGPTQPTGDRGVDARLRCRSLSRGAFHGVLRGQWVSNHRRDWLDDSAVVAIVVETGAQPYKSWTRTLPFGAFTFRDVPSGDYTLLVAHPRAQGIFWSAVGVFDANRPQCVLPPAGMGHIPMLP